LYVPGWQTQEAEGTVEFGGEVIGRVRALSTDISARDDGMLLVADDAADAATLGLGHRGRAVASTTAHGKKEAFHAS
jgi:hypothetical protein